MGQREREQIYNAIDIMQEAVHAMEKLLKENQIDEITCFLMDCQDCAIAVGNKIEKIYGNNLEIIHRLEVFCECLYEMSQVLLEETAYDKQKELKEILKTIRIGFAKELKKEALFLPYKASMWDSLESVWMAAKEDEEYIARVMPIPYFDRDENGNFKEMHWEGDVFPDYVPITRYDEYDIREHQPDMIFIHNPYDDYNRVTSIHPNYYSVKLKEYTEKLVYIPYFILDEIKPNDKVRIENCKHYCLTPAVINSDCVIVQSEDMRQIYINILSEHMGEHTRSKWEKKILGLGSPKVDKVLNTRKQDIEIPQEWNKIILKPDGSWKKIIFYNTSLNAFLRNSDIMLDKIESVLAFFKDNKEDVALLWRPHPLYRSTIQSMHPEQTERYDNIVAKYKQEGWGIYDDTPDMDRAVVLSDAYYGDGSSVERLYEKTGKYIMFQDPRII